jgi:energy-coupling factor transporter ATP-binding protein EcfA2
MAYKNNGVVETIYSNFLREIRAGTCTIESIVKLIKELRKYEMDCHIVIAGQNGLGKSMLLLMLMKALGSTFNGNLFLADKTTNDLILYLLRNEDSCLGIDELTLYFGYKEHASLEQTHLIKMVELARSKKIAIIGCVRDARKLTYNYRNGKMSIVLWIPDRFMDGGAYAAVFVVNPVIESEDRFGFSVLNSSISSFDELRGVFEEYVPSFRGYLKIPKTSKVLTKEELDWYFEFKKKAMAYAHLNQLIKQLKKKVISADEFNEQIKELRQILPADEMNKLMPQQKSITEFGDDDD